MAAAALLEPLELSMWYAGLVPGAVSINVKFEDASLCPLELRM